MNAAERIPLLEDLSRLAHREARNVDPINTFLPLPSHRIALRKEVVVIRGGRGAGKSALFHMLSAAKTELAARRLLPEDEFREATWIDAFSQEGPVHPEVSVMDSWGTHAAESAMRAFWMAYLLRRVSQEIGGIAVPNALEDAWSRAGNDPAKWVPAAETMIGEISGALDSAERYLEERDQSVFAAYDYLDRLGAFDRDLRKRFVSTLLALWLSLSNRYRRLRAKIFLREDLFEAGELGFPDASKLRPRSVSLEWDVESLYRVAVRHMAVVSQPLRDWVKRLGLEGEDQGDLGWMPGQMLQDRQRTFAERFAGKLMGKGLNKGYTYRWIPNRLQDAQIRIVPRSMLSLLGFAGDAAKKKPLAKGTRLVSPKDLYAALERTSMERVAEIKEEYPAVIRLENLRGLFVLLERNEVVERLAKPIQAERPGLPTDGELIMDELVRLGVLSVRQDGRIDVPDIYRYGYGIKRKGGVARPK